MSDPLREHRDIAAYIAKTAAAFYDHAFSDYDAEGFRTLRTKDRERWLLAFEKQLLDLTRPESMDALSRILAARVGLVVGATAPEFHRVFPCWWELRAAYSQERQWTMVFCDPADYEVDPPAIRGHKVAVPGISALTTPTEALFAALIATRPTNVL